jgi:hypothetical protein
MTWQRWGSKQALEKGKTSLSLMEVFNIALKCRVFRFQELLNAYIVCILQEWLQFPQEWLRRLVRSMMRRVTEILNKRGGYTRY